jgi:hypothetical protein
MRMGVARLRCQRNDTVVIVVLPTARTGIRGRAMRYEGGLWASSLSSAAGETYEKRVRRQSRRPPTTRNASVAAISIAIGTGLIATG